MSSTSQTKTTRNKTLDTIEALRRIQPATCKTLATETGIGAAEVASNLRAIERAHKYGVYKAGLDTVAHHRGCAVTLWAIDEDKYQAYMAKKAHMQATQRPPAPKRIHPVKEPKVEYQRDFPRPITKYHTVWQPTSPYHKENP